MSHPIHLLPPELLGKIFVECLPNNDWDRLDVSQPPLSLCRVNSWWRTIALAEHALWDTIILPSSDRGSLRKSKAFLYDGHVDAWFQRTGPERTLSFGEAPSDTSSFQPLDLLSTIRQYAPRLRHISLKPSHYRYISSYYNHKLSTLDFPVLTSVSVCCSVDLPDYGPHSHLGSHIPTLFSSAPRLAGVSLRLLKVSPTVFLLPWRTITSITVDHADRPMKMLEWLALCHTCPALEEVSVIRPILGGCRLGHNIRHNALKRLRIQLISPPAAATTSTTTSDGSPAAERTATATASKKASKPLPAEDWHVLKAPVDFPNLVYLELEFDLSGGRTRSPSKSLVDLAQYAALASMETLVLTTRTHRNDNDANTTSRICTEPLQEARALVRELLKKPRAFRKLTHLKLGYYHSSGYRELLELLKKHPIKALVYPGLRVTARVMPGEWEAAMWDDARNGVKEEDFEAARSLLLEGQSKVVLSPQIPHPALKLTPKEVGTVKKAGKNRHHSSPRAHKARNLSRRKQESTVVKEPPEAEGSRDHARGAIEEGRMVKPKPLDGN